MRLLTNRSPAAARPAPRATRWRCGGTYHDVAVVTWASGLSARRDGQKRTLRKPDRKAPQAPRGAAGHLARLVNSPAAGEVCA